MICYDQRMPRLALSFVIVAVLAPQLAVADDAPVVTCHPTTGKITAQFAPDISVAQLSTWVTGFTCKNVIFGAGVAKYATKVNITAPKELTAKQALQLYVDAVEAAGFVVVQKNDSIIIKLGPNMAKGCPDVAATTPTPTPTPTPTRPPTSGDTEEKDELEARLEAGVRQIDATHVELDRALVDALLANPMALAKGARIVPAVKDGKPHGFKLYAVRPSSFIARLGLTNGDTVVAINGQDVSTVDKALEAYATLRDVKQLVFDVERRGKLLKLTITIVN